MKKTKWLEHREITDEERRILNLFSKNLKDVETEANGVVPPGPYGYAGFFGEAYRRTQQDLKK